MRRAVTSLALTLLLAAVAFAEPVIKLPTDLKAKPGRLLRITVETTGKQVRWVSASADADVIAIREDGKAAIFSAPTPGVYRILAWTAEGDVPSEAAVATVTVGDAPPPGPTPPGPTPPTPPTPVPPGPAGQRVLILYESADVSKMPSAQQAILFSKQVRDYLDAHTVPGPDGKTKEWRIWDAQVDIAAAAKPWQDLFSRKREGTPWMIIGGEPGVVFEGPLPADVPGTMALLKKHLEGAGRGQKD